MIDLSTKVASLKMDWNSVIEKLLGITDENFNDNFREIKTIALHLKNSENEIKSQATAEEMKKIDLELEDVTKKTKNTFDNIIKDKEEEINRVSIELSNLTNQKKLALYKR
ncbi:MAG: hypothetical protein NTX22_09325 [Ignavibacteriales bacterium]|nr:hypothetical protein [Ignavibacteriales bacterium]